MDESLLEDFEGFNESPDFILQYRTRGKVIGWADLQEDYEEAFDQGLQK